MSSRFAVSRDGLHVPLRVPRVLPGSLGRGHGTSSHRGDAACEFLVLASPPCGSRCGGAAARVAAPLHALTGNQTAVQGMGPDWAGQVAWRPVSATAYGLFTCQHTVPPPQATAVSAAHALVRPCYDGWAARLAHNLVASQWAVLQWTQPYRGGRGSMPKARSRTSIQQQIADFERQNPKVVEAMRLFGMTMAEYQATLSALYGPRVSTSDSTTRLDTDWRG